MPWPLVVMAIGAAISAMGQAKAARAQKRAAYDEALQTEENGRQTYAQKVRAADEIRRQGDSVLSDARAAMVAGGGVSTDAGAVQNLARIDREIEYNRLGQIYEGGVAYNTAMKSAASLRRTGKATQAAGNLQATGTVLQAAGSAYRQYQKGN